MSRFHRLLIHHSPGMAHLELQGSLVNGQNAIFDIKDVLIIFAYFCSEFAEHLKVLGCQTSAFLMQDQAWKRRPQLGRSCNGSNLFQKSVSLNGNSEFINASGSSSLNVNSKAWHGRHTWKTSPWRPVNPAIVIIAGLAAA